MRSLIKGHRRTDSSTSESPNVYSEPRAYHRHNKTPQASPKVGSSASNLHHLTPPQPQYQGSSSTLSSPKKLLTPIKKMFGHHTASKNTTPTSSEALHSALNLDPPPRRQMSPSLHSPRSMSNLNELPSHQNGAASRPGPHAAHARHQSTSYLYSSALSPGASQMQDGSNTFTLGRPFESSSSLNSGGYQKKGQMKIMDEDSLTPVADSLSGQNGDSDSNRSIAKSINFSAKQASSQEILAGSSSRSNTDDYDDNAYSSDDLSDTSSQFSFVKDIRGGRNTSVKYYKTKPSRAPRDPNAPSNTFDVDAFGFEEDGLSDYDYENNGLDDEDDLEDFEAKYDYDNENDILGEGDISKQLSPPPVPTVSVRDCNTPEQLVQSSSDENAPHDSTDHFITANSSHNFLTPQPEEHSYGEDFLESYMDNTKSPGSEIPETPQSQVFNLPSITTSLTSSPLINGVTFGLSDGLKNRQAAARERTLPTEDNSIGLAIGPGEQIPEQLEEPRRNSIMALLGSLDMASSKAELEEDDPTFKSAVDLLEQVAEPVEPVESTDGEQAALKDSRRQSILNMMETLSSLAISTEVQSAEKKKEARKSVMDMMDTLAALDSGNKANGIQSSRSTAADVSLPKEGKVNAQDQSTPSNSFSVDTSTDDGRAYHLDEEMLLECNQLPEDFDFESFQNQDLLDGTSDFYRSNSYNKRPTKIVRDNSVRSNKIETPQRTVTFYRSNSLAKNDDLSSVSLSRNGTLYSTISSTSGEDESTKETENYRQKLPYAYNANLQLKEKSFDCLSHRSFSLEPINESEVPSSK